MGRKKTPYKKASEELNWSAIFFLVVENKTVAETRSYTRVVNKTGIHACISNINKYLRKYLTEEPKREKNTGKMSARP